MAEAVKRTRKKRFSLRLTNEEHESNTPIAKSVINELGYSIAAPCLQEDDEEDDICVWYLSEKSWQLGFAGDESPCTCIQVSDRISEKQVATVWKDFLSKELKQYKRCPPFVIICGCFDDAASARRLIELARETIGFRAAVFIDARIAALAENNKITGISIHLDQDRNTDSYMARYLGIYEGFRIAEGKCVLHASSEASIRRDHLARVLSCVIDSLALDCRLDIKKNILVVGPAAEDALGGHGPELSKELGLAVGNTGHLVFPPHFKYCAWIGVSKVLCSLHQVADALRNTSKSQSALLLNDSDGTLWNQISGLENDLAIKSTPFSLNIEAERDELLGLALAKLGFHPPTVPLLTKPISTGPLWLPFWPKIKDTISVQEHNNIIVPTRKAAKQVVEPNKKNTTQSQKNSIEQISSSCTPATENEISVALAQHSDDLLGAIDFCKQNRLFTCAQILRIVQETPLVKTRLAAISVLGQRCSDPDNCRVIADLFRYDTDKKAVEKIFKDRSTKLKSASASKSGSKSSFLSRSGRGGGRGRGRSSAMPPKKARPVEDTADDTNPKMVKLTDPASLKANPVTVKQEEKVNKKIRNKDQNAPIGAVSAKMCTLATEDEISAALAQYSDDLLAAIDACKGDRLFTCAQILRIVQHTPSVRTRLAAICVLGQRCSDPESCREIIGLFRYDAEKKDVEKIFKDRSTKIKSASASGNKSSFLRGGRSSTRGGRGGSRGRTSASLGPIKKFETSSTTATVVPSTELVDAIVRQTETSEEKSEEVRTVKKVTDARRSSLEIVSNASRLATDDEINSALAENRDDHFSAVESCKKDRLFTCAQILRIVQETESVKTRLAIIGVLGQRCSDPEACRDLISLFCYDADKKFVEKVFKDRSSKIKAVTQVSKTSGKVSPLRGGRGGGTLRRSSTSTTKMVKEDVEEEIDTRSALSTAPNDIVEPVKQEEEEEVRTVKKVTDARRSSLEIVSNASSLATDDEINSALAENRDDLFSAVESCKKDRLFTCAQILRIVQETESVKTRLAIIGVLGQRCSDPEACRDLISLFCYDADKKFVEKVFKDRSSKIKAVSQVSKTSGKVSPLRGGRGGGTIRRSSTSTTKMVKENVEEEIDRRSALSTAPNDIVEPVKQEEEEVRTVKKVTDARRSSLEIVSNASRLATDDEINSALAENRDDLFSAVESCKKDRLFTCAQILRIVQETESVKTRLAIIGVLGQRCSDPEACRDLISLFCYDADKKFVEKVFKDRSSKIKAVSQVSKTSGKVSPLRGGRGGGTLRRSSTSTTKMVKENVEEEIDRRSALSTAPNDIVEPVKQEEVRTVNKVTDARRSSLEIVSNASRLATDDEINSALAENRDDLFSAVESCKKDRLFTCAQILRIVQETESVKTRLAIIGVLGQRCSDPEACRDLISLFCYDADKKFVEKVFKDRSSKIKAVSEVSKLSFLQNTRRVSNSCLIANNGMPPRGSASVVPSMLPADLGDVRLAPVSADLQTSPQRRMRVPRKSSMRVFERTSESSAYEVIDTYFLRPNPNLVDDTDDSYASTDPRDTKDEPFKMKYIDHDDIPVDFDIEIDINENDDDDEKTSYMKIDDGQTQNDILLWSPQPIMACFTPGDEVEEAH